MSGARALAILAGAAFGATSARFAVRDSDVFWHLATGRELLASGPLGTDRFDHFSWTAAGTPLSVDQWLGQIAWYAAYRLDEWRGIVALRSLAVFALIALVVGEAIARRPSRPLVGVIAALPAIAITRFVWVERPELFGFVCFAALLPLLRRGREGSDRALVVAIGLLVLWANLHGSFALGVALALLAAIEGALRDRPRRRAYAILALGSLVAVVATPAGIGTLGAPGSHLLHPPREILEWSVPDPLSLPGAIWAATLGAVVATALLAPRPRPTDAIVLVPVALLSMTAARHMPLLCIAAAPYLADRAPEAIAAVLRRATREPRAPRALPRGAWLATAVISVTLLAGATLAAPREPDLGGYPVAALAALPKGPGLLNNYDWGGWLIWYAPDTPVFVDGRLVPYLPDVLDDYRAIVGLHPDWSAVLRRRGVRSLLVRPTDAIAVRARDLGWNVRAAGADFVLIDAPNAN